MAWVDAKTTFGLTEPPEVTARFLLDLTDEPTHVDAPSLESDDDPSIEVEVVCFEDDVTSPYSPYVDGDDPTQVDVAPLR